MAERVIIDSDLSGKAGAKPYSFVLDGVNYDIDLTPDEHQVLEEELESLRKVTAERLQRFMEAGRPSPVGTKRVLARKVPVTSIEERVKIREWAAKHWEGEPVPPYGQIRVEVIKEYDRANGITDRVYRTANKATRKYQPPKKAENDKLKE